MIISTTWLFPSITCLPSDNIMPPRPLARPKFGCVRAQSGATLCSPPSGSSPTLICYLHQPLQFCSHCIFLCHLVDFKWICRMIFKKKPTHTQKKTQHKTVPLKCWLVSFPYSPQRTMMTPLKPQFSWSLINLPVFFTHLLWLFKSHLYF